MALGKREQGRQQDLLVPVTRVQGSPGHPFYARLNQLLAKAGFDRRIEELCAPYYAETHGRPSIPPGIYFRMLLIGYFEGIDSQRGIAWRYADSRSLQEFLGYLMTERTPDHSSLTRVRQRLPLEVHEEAFALVVSIAKEHGLVKGKTLAVDSTTLEANAAMKSIVRRDTKTSWKKYVKQLAKEDGDSPDDPSDDDARRFDRKRGKKVSNKDWESPSDPDARITKMKDGRTRLAYKAQHTIDLETDIALAASVHFGTESDGELLKEAICDTAGVAFAIGLETTAREVVADRGYHKAESLAWCMKRSIRTYVATPRSSQRRRWTDKPAEWRVAYQGNRRRGKSSRARRLHRKRSELVERSFAHVCWSGGARRTWIRGLEEVSKRYLIQVAARNLGLIMRKAFGVGSPKALAAQWHALVATCWSLYHSLARLITPRAATQAPSSTPC